METKKSDTRRLKTNTRRLLIHIICSLWQYKMLIAELLLNVVESYKASGSCCWKWDKRQEERVITVGWSSTILTHIRRPVNARIRFGFLFSELLRTFLKNEISLVINPKIQQLNKIKRNKQTKQVLAVKKKDHHRLWKSLTLDQIVIRRRWNPFSSVGNSF